MARKSGFVRRGGRMVRETLWVGIGETDTALASAGTAVLFTGLTANLLSLRPFTIVRTRGLIHVISDQVSAAETFGAMFGMCVVSDQALAVGITAVPTPGADRASDLWFVYEEIFGRLILNTAIGVQTYGRDGCKYFDSKAMRKIEEGQDLSITVEAMTISSGVQIKKAGRLLIKLH